MVIPKEEGILSDYLKIPHNAFSTWKDEASSLKIPLIPYLVKVKNILPQQILNYFHSEERIPILNSIQLCRELKAINRKHIDFLIKNNLLIIKYSTTSLLIGIYDSHQTHLQHDIEFLFNLPVSFVICAYNELSHWLHSLHFLSIIHKDAQTTDNKDTYCIHLTDACLTDAIFNNASDIHFEPYENEFIIRLRIHGVLSQQTSLPIHQHKSLINRIKILASLDITETRRPQDGRFTFKTPFFDVRDCRINSCPTIHGEKLVIRLLDPHQKIIPINELGLPSLSFKAIISSLSKPQGLILVTGPTGSGKSQTLYTLINHIKSSTKNITTVENPVEIQMHAITQINSHHHIGLDFSTLLRSLLRQDPDVIMIGEIRDKETAEIAISAAQTGHLVFSTLHTNNAPEAIDRFKHLGINPYNLANALSLIIAQRLIRILCAHCKLLDHDNAMNKSIPQSDSSQYFIPQGCSHCHDGYHNRKAIFEILDMKSGIKDTFISDNMTKTLSTHLDQQGHQTLWDAGVQLASSGQTSLAELFRVVSPS